MSAKMGYAKLKGTTKAAHCKFNNESSLDHDTQLSKVTNEESISHTKSCPIYILFEEHFK